MTVLARICVVLAAVLALAAPAAAVTVIDSSFEEGGFEDGGIQRGSALTFGRLSQLPFDAAASGSAPVNPPLDNIALSAIPDATTWALLMTGFASVGLLARRRRARRPMVAA